MDERLLLVLDLDETLLHATESRLLHAADHELPPYFLYRRPGLTEFISTVSAAFRLAVWTSAAPAYARAVCPWIFPDLSRLEFVWASDRCTPTRDFETDRWCHAKPLKKLKRLGYDLNRVVMVDDSPEKHTRNYGNLVQIAPFMGDPNDDELSHLAVYLTRLATEPNVRRIEKRFWRGRLASSEAGLNMVSPSN